MNPNAVTLKRLVFFLCIISWSLTVQARCEAADSIISRMHRTAGIYADYITEYQANLYVKSQLDIIKKNWGFRHIPGLFKSEKDVNRYIMETYSDLHFTAPHIYDQKIKAMAGTVNDSRNIPGMMDFFNINIYSPYLLGKQLLSPLAPNSNRYYIYTIDSISCDSQQRIEYHIRYTPRNKSFQLIEGEMTVTEGVWSVRKFNFKARSELLDFTCSIDMGEIGQPDEYLPANYNINVLYAFAFNVVEGYYEAILKYHDIKFKTSAPVSAAKKNYNLSGSFSLRCDSTSYQRNESSFDSLRLIPLTNAERLIYRKYQKRQAAKNRENEKPRPVTTKDKWNSIGDFLFDDNRWNLADNVTLHSSPFINPLLISFSKSYGISYRQDLKFSTRLKNERSIYTGARLGYNFNNKEFYWTLGTDYTYWPEHRGILHINLGNGNRISSSQIIDELKKLPTDSVLNVNDLNLEQFSDFNIEISNQLEIINGLNLHVGLIFHQRTPIEKPDIPFYNLNLPEHVQEGLKSSVRPQYRSFAPRIKVEWTPGQYYYMNGRQKVNLGSRFPTFILDYERGIGNVFKSTGVYERIEFDMQHHIKLGLLSNLYYRFGTGFFTNMKETYFVDFVNFRKNNLPNGWNDEIGGVFQALNGKWYNVSPYYVRGHITYEAPFLLLRHLIKYTSHVQNERIYLNMLTMSHLGPYFELGYGIGTFIFDAGVFMSLEHYNKIGFGFKLTFELFD